MSDGKYKTTKERLIDVRERGTIRQNKCEDEDRGNSRIEKIDLESILIIAERMDIMIHLLEPSPLSDKLVYHSRQLIVAIKKAILDRDGIKY